jgi:signal transduction histidine kinase
VRYISHEIRTPLNTVSVGIQLLQKNLLSLENEINELITQLNSQNAPFYSSQISISFPLSTSPPTVSEQLIRKLSALKDSSVVDMKTMIEDISLSCVSSINILNDLLVYDKVEEGHLVLRQQYVRIIDCIISYSKPFQLQADEAGVFFNYSGKKQPIPNQPPDEENLANIVVCIDRFKIAQVFRNFLSNAFKHTPRGGSVTLTTRMISKDNVNQAGVYFAWSLFSSIS